MRKRITIVVATLAVALAAGVPQLAAPSSAGSQPAPVVAKACDWCAPGH
ncbi:hypothetical protein AB0B85_01530 [Micromonospora sp. NPDC049044]